MGIIESVFEEIGPKTLHERDTCMPWQTAAATASAVVFGAANLQIWAMSMHSYRE
jgi:hypothetical protein